MKPVKIINKPLLEEVIKKDEYAIGALIHIYQYQTTDEQISRSVKENNNRGFNATDGMFASSLAEQYLSKKKLTTKQIAAIRKLIPKYHSQIDTLVPLRIKKIRKRINKKFVAPVDGKVVSMLNKDTLLISFPFDYQTVAQVKLLSERSWDKSRKRWTAPISILSIDDLLLFGFTLEDDVRKWYDSQQPKIKAIKEIKGLNATLYPYQADGVSYIESRNGRALVGDEMGLGKTIQALAWMQLNKDKDIFPALVICPSSIKLNWARETLKFTELKPSIISGRIEKGITTFPNCENPNVFIINYDILHEMVDCGECGATGKINDLHCPKCKGKKKLAKLDSWLKNMNFKTMVADECQKLSNIKAGRTIAGTELSKDCKSVIGLSGTPIVNRPIEFFNILNMINSSIFPSWWKYTGRYCDRKNTGFGTDVSGASNLEELHEKLTKTVMIRRLKKDVLPDLPIKVRSTVPIEIDMVKYTKTIERAKKDLKGKDANHLSIIEKAKQTVVELKMKSCLEWIENYIDSGEKLVVFADHRNVIEEVHNYFKDSSVVVYGGTADSERQKAVDTFQNDPNCKLFIGSKAAKEGLTLTAASSTCFLELWWESGSHLQAEDRVHRIGQKSDSVNTYYLLAANTIEEDIMYLLEEKSIVLDQVLDGVGIGEGGIFKDFMEVFQKS